MSVLLPSLPPPAQAKDGARLALDAWWHSVDVYESAPEGHLREAAAVRMRMARAELVEALGVDPEDLDDELAAFAAGPSLGPAFPPPG
jgi:hypothetical protein